MAHGIAARAVGAFGGCIKDRDAPPEQTGVVWRMLG